MRELQGSRDGARVDARPALRILQDMFA